MKLDVHTLFLKDAIDEIMYKFDECKEFGDNTLEIIHGHKHGTRIKNYIRSDGFFKEVFRNGHEIINKNFSDDGKTIFQIKSLKITSNNNEIPKSNSNGNTTESELKTIYCLKCNNSMILLKEFNWFKCPKCGKLIKR